MVWSPGVRFANCLSEQALPSKLDPRAATTAQWSLTYVFQTLGSDPPNTPNVGLATPRHTLTMEPPSTDEMEQFQRLSDQYQPDVPGPLIGNKQSIAELVREFAKADRTFVAKTTALAATHTTYRKVKGDGQCGWRGATCGYFEILLNAGDTGLVMQEETRIRSFEDTMKMVGIDYDLMEDMFEPTWELFAAIRTAVETKEARDNVILDFFNDENRSNSIVYHFKMMTSSYMQLRPDAYEPFLEMPIHEYRVSRIDPTNQEIDQIGLQVLTDGVIAPAGIAVDVLYLDRSVGDQVTPYHFVPNATDWPTIRLLYRPGHYDLIYKGNSHVRILIQTDDAQTENISEVGMHGFDPYLHSYLFPNASMQSPPDNANPETDPSPHFQSQYHSVPNSYQVPRFSPNPPYQPPPSSLVSLPPVPIPRRQSSPNSQPLVSTPMSPSPHKAQTPTSNEPQIRYNANTYQYSLQRHESIPLDPGGFGSSALSHAHFLNSEFQPEIWNAEQEYGRS